MNPVDLRNLLESVQDGDTAVEDAMERLKDLPFAELGYATVDHHRALRSGFPEVIFGQGKTVEQIAGLVEEIASHEQTVLVTRVAPEAGEALEAQFDDLAYEPLSRTAVLSRGPAPATSTHAICVVSAGTSDLPVAEEAAVTAEVYGNRVDRVYDVGVAGIHRLLRHRERLDAAAVLIVVAGMEGALASVVGGLVSRPVIAVPTSIGYGASFGGVAALLAMLNSCASGVTVVNIDNGFGAAHSASLINRLTEGGGA